MPLLLALGGGTARGQATACAVDYAAATLHDERDQPQPAYHEVVQALLDHGL